MKLISMTDFVLQEQKGGQQVNSITSQLHFELRRIKNYANFLKQPLKLEMFVPCDENGNVLDEKLVENYENDFGLYSDFEKYNKEYNKATEKVFFEGFEFTESQKYSVNNHIKLSVSPYGLNNEKLLLTKLNEENNFHTWLKLNTIEDLIQCKINLTPNAIKKFQL